MSDVADQGYVKFKVFAGKPAADGTLGPLGAEVEKWAASVMVSPRTIGIEYLEASASLLLTVGYRDDERGYRIKLSSVRLGRIDTTDPDGLTTIEAWMLAASAKVRHIISHELYVTSTSDLLMVFMVHES